MRLVVLQQILNIFRGRYGYLPIYIQQHKFWASTDKINTLIIGSSHMSASYNADINLGEFKYSSSSQDLYYSYKIYEKCFKQKPEISNIVISYSVFTPGHEVIKTGDADICAIYKALEKIDYQFKSVAFKKMLPLLEIFYKILIWKLYKKTQFYTNRKNSTEIVFSENANVSEESVRQRALKHYKNNQRKTHQLDYLKLIFDKATERNQKVFVVIAPMTSVYRSVLPASEELFEKLYNLAENYQNVTILNYYDSDKFSDTDFYDGDHLNKYGTEKSTAMINEAIYHDNITAH